MGSRVSWFIEGVPILGDFSMPLTVGVNPATAVATVAPSDLTKLLEMGRKKRNGITMVASPVSGPSVTYSGMNIIHNTNAADPNLAAVVIADRRYWWPYQFVYREMNIRRATGNKRRESMERPLINDPVVDILQYAKFSLNAEGKPWKATEVLKDLIKFIDLTSVDATIQDAKELASVPFENITLRGQGHMALAQILGLVAGAEITISNTGTPIVFSWASGAERDVVGTGLIGVGGEMGPEQFSGGHVDLVERGNVRPEKIIVLVDIESELRFDFIGDKASEVDSTRPTEGTDDAGLAILAPTPRYIQNVLPIPDFTLALTDDRTVVTGQWLPVGEYLEAITKLTKGGLAPDVTFTTLFRAMVPFQRHLWAALALTGDTLLASTEANWSARISALQRHVRQTWQIPRDWMDRIRVLKNHLVATVDTSRGIRAQSRIYSDHFRLNTAKSLFLTAGAKAYGANIKGWPGKGEAPRAIVADDIPAPADLVILDPEIGIIHTAYLADPNGNYQEALPGLLINNPVADKEPGNRDGPVYFNSIAAGSTKFPQLDPDSKLAIILTATPANQLFAIEVGIEDVGAVVPRAVRDGLKDAKGPPMYLYTARETARVAWSEDAAKAIETAFLQAVKPGFDKLTDATKLLRPHVMNLGEAAGGAASLNDVAVEIAAKTYAKMVDRPEGSMSGFIADTIAPVGAIDSVIHSIAADGRLQTAVNLRTQLPDFNVVAMLDPGTQRILLRLIKPQGG